MEEIEFTLKGKRYELSRRQVLSKLKGVSPEPVRSHAVEVGGVLYPAKQAFAAVVAVDRLDFTTMQARDVFRRLDFKCRRVE